MEQVKRKSGSDEESDEVNNCNKKQMLQPEPEIGSQSSDEFHFSDSFDSENEEPNLPASGDEKAIAASASGDAKTSFYDLPSSINHLLRRFRKIDKLYDWQERLMQKLLQDNRNAIYCVPTSGGKTLVAELMLMRQLLHDKQDAILVLPFVSIVQEKLRSLRPFAEQLGFVIEEYAGSRGSVPVKKRHKMRTLFVATIEKANVVITSLHEANRLNEIGLFVIDELHMIGDGSARGVTLETLIVKTKLAAAKANTSIRFIGMSATLNNFNDLSKFLDAEIIRDNFRPVELVEYLKIEENLFDVSSVAKGRSCEDIPLARKIDAKHVKEDPEDIRILVGEVIPHKSCLVFCPSKKHCESLSLMLSRCLPNRMELLQYQKAKKEQLVQAICQSNNGSICNVLMKTLPYGVAYHHSGLTPDERMLIEIAFTHQILSCIVCTSTLAAGVNLPAERVIIRDPYVGRTFLSKAQYQQMCGRAGRAGLCEKGESILITSGRDKLKVKELLETPMPSCISSLKDLENGLSAFLLTLLRMGLAQTVDDLIEIVIRHTLAGIQKPTSELKAAVSKSIEQLTSLRLVIRQQETDYLTVTKVGNGVVRSLIDVTRSLSVFEELKHNQQNMDLSNNLQLFYLTTLLFDEKDLPLSVDSESLLFSYNDLTEDEQKSAELFGLSIGVVSSYSRNLRDSKPTPKIRRLYLTLILYEVWSRRTDLSLLAAKHNMQRGTLYTLIQQAATCANALYRFVEEMREEFSNLFSLLPNITEALTHCCIPELMPLMQLPEIRVPRARQLYMAGFKDIMSIAKCKSTKDLTSKIEHLNSSQAKRIITGAIHHIRSQRDELQQQVKEMRLLEDQFQEAADTSVGDESVLFDV